MEIKYPNKKEVMMQIKTTICFFFAGVLLLFLSASEAWSDEDCTVTIGKGTWKFELISGPTSVAEGCDLKSAYDPDEEVFSEECYQYDYQVIPPSATAPINQALLTFPVNLDEEVLVGGFNQVFKPAQGDDNIYLGEGVQEVFVGRFPPVTNDKKWSIYSNIDRVSLATVAVTSGKYSGTCGIDGPNPNGVDPNAIFTFSSFEEVTTSDNKKFQFERDSKTRCIINAWKWEQVDNVWQWVSMNKVPIGQVLKAYGDWGEAKVEIGIGDENQACYDSWIKSEGDHTWYKINGKYVWR